MKITNQNLPYKKMIYDGDPGHDDIMAILLALGTPEIELLGITTVAGNATLEMTTRNALMVTELGRLRCPRGRRDVPARSSARFILRRWCTAHPALREPSCLNRTANRSPCTPSIF